MNAKSGTIVGIQSSNHHETPARTTKVATASPPSAVGERRQVAASSLGPSLRLSWPCTGLVTAYGFILSVRSWSQLGALDMA